MSPLVKKYTLDREAPFFLWSNIHRLPRFFIERWQFLKLKHVVDLAYRNVPFYRALFEGKGIVPPGIRRLEDIALLPVVTKFLLRNNFPAVLNRTFPTGSFGWGHTSGSTGEPFTFATNNVYTKNFPDKRYADFNWYRFLTWRGLSFRYVVEKLRAVKFTHRSKPDRENRMHLKKEGIWDPFLTGGLKKFGVELIEGRPGILLELARNISSRTDSLKIPYLVSYGETLSPESRAFLENAHGSKVYDRYGLEEIGTIAADCSEHSGFHVYEDSCIVEVLDEKGNPLPSGKTGKVVVTYFFNDVMPFIRYDTGDKGVLLDPCPCGLPAKKIYIEGRAEEPFISVSNLKMVHLSEFETILERYSRLILRYQLVKTGDDALELRILPTKNLSEAVMKDLQDKIKSTVQYLPSISIVDKLVYNDSDKSPVFVDLTLNKSELS